MADPRYSSPGRPNNPVQPGNRGDTAGLRRPTVDAGRLWAGGLATAVVAALVAIVGLLVAKVFDVETLRPLRGDSFFDSPAVRFALAAAVAALAATALMHLLILSTPRPRSFFAWIVLLCT